MIFVILGTQDKSFERLLNKIEELKKQKIIKDDIVVQSGYTKYNSKIMSIFDYLPMNEFENYINKADLIITHGGAGSILGSLKKNKKVIAVPRLSKYGEHTNDHQLQIVKELANDGYILSCLDLNELGHVIEKSKDFIPKKYVPDNKRVVDTINNYIEKSNNYNKSIIYILVFLLCILLIIFFVF